MIQGCKKNLLIEKKKEEKKQKLCFLNHSDPIETTCILYR